MNSNAIKKMVKINAVENIIKKSNLVEKVVKKNINNKY